MEIVITSGSLAYKLIPPSLKICFVCNEYPPMPGGGIGIFVKTLAESLANLGMEVWVIGYGKKKQHSFIQNGVHVKWIYLPYILHKKIWIKGYPYSITGLIKRHYLSFQLAKLHRVQVFDLVESYDFSGPLAFKPECPLIVRLHGSVTVYRYEEGRPAQISPLDRHFEIKNVRMADQIIAVSQHIGNMTNLVMKANKPFEVICNGVVIDLFSPRQAEKKEKSILFVGNMIWRKGVFDLIAAFPLIQKRHPDVNLILAGGCSGEHKNRLDDELAKLDPGVRERIRLLGRIPYDQLPELYNRTSVFVFPSRVEAFGLTCVEAMVCGRPVVATRLASGPELVEDGVSGLLADPANPADLAEKIIRILDDPKIGESLGVNARKRAQDKFDLKKIVAENLEFYRSILWGAHE